MLNIFLLGYFSQKSNIFWENYEKAFLVVITISERNGTSDDKNTYNMGIVPNAFPEKVIFSEKIAKNIRDFKTYEKIGRLATKINVTLFIVNNLKNNIYRDALKISPKFCDFY